MNFARKIASILSIMSLYIGSLKAVEVDRNMLLWEEGYNYLSSLEFRLNLTGVNFAGLDDEGRPIKGGTKGISDLITTFNGIMNYETTLYEKDSTSYEGSALRKYFNCALDSTMQNYGDSNIYFSIKADGLWDSGVVYVGTYIKKWMGDIDKEIQVVDIIKDESGNRYVTGFFPNTLVNNKTSGLLSKEFEIFQDLTNKTYILEWNSPIKANKASLNIKSLSGASRLSPTVVNAIERESTMLYNAVIAGKARKAGDIWRVEGSTLKALIHPAMSARLDGFVVVKAEEVINETPPSRVANPMSGIKLKFLSGGKIDGFYVNSTLRLSMGTQNGDSVNIFIDFSSHGNKGEIWLDNLNEIVAFAILNISGAKYKGNMPKIGEVAKDLDVNGNLSLEVKYNQTKESQN